MPEQSLNIQVWILRLAFLSLLGLLAVNWPRLRKLVAEEPRAIRWSLLLVLVAGVVVRVGWSLWSVNHENAIGWVIFEDAARLDHFPSYGLGGHVLYNAWLKLFGTRPDVIFAGNFVLASLTPLLLFMLVRRLFGCSRGALLAAALIALNPVHVRLSASESLHIPAMFFALLTLVALHVALQSRDAWLPVLLAAVSFALAVQTRPLGVLLILPVVASLLLRPRAEGIRWRWLALGAAMAFVLCAVHGMWLWERVQDSSGMSFFRVAPRDILPRLIQPAKHAFVDPAVTPLALQVLVVLGLVGMLVRRWRSAIVVLAILLPAVYLNTTHGQNPVEHLRFHLGVLPWFALSAGGATLLLEKVSGRGKDAVFALVVLVVAASLPLHRSVLSPRYDAHRELSFWQTQLSEFPPGFSKAATLVSLDRFQADHSLTTELPISWFAAFRWTTGRFVSASDYLRNPARKVLWYRGITCWYHEPNSEPAKGPAMRELCRRVEESGTLRPIVETAFEANPARFRVRVPEMTIGFYELTQGSR